MTLSGSLSFFAEHFFWFADFFSLQLHKFSLGTFPEDGKNLVKSFHIIHRGRCREEQRWAGGGGGAQRPVLRGNEPKKTGACSAAKIKCEVLLRSCVIIIYEFTYLVILYTRSYSTRLCSARLSSKCIVYTPVYPTSKTQKGRKEKIKLFPGRHF